MAGTGEHAETVSATLRSDAGLGHKNPLFELRRQIGKMTTDERESFLKRLQELITSARNGGRAVVAG